MKEIEVIVESYEKTYEIFKSMGFTIKREMEKKRTRYTKGKVVFDIDFWPQIPPFVEIEADSLDSAKGAAKELGLNPSEGLICSPSNVYVKYGINPNDYVLMTFDKFVKR
jgi:adenylate cyclase, class 2